MNVNVHAGTEHKELVYGDARAYNENVILKILKWLSNKTATLHQTIRESVPQDKDCGAFSDAQLLVTLLRALGLRVRLVMVLNPIPFKESKASGTGKSGKGSEEKTVTVVSYQEKALSEEGEGMELTVEPDAPSKKKTRSLKERKSTGNNRGKSVEDSEVIVAGADEEESGEKMDLTIEPDALSSPSKKEAKSFVKRRHDKSQSKSGSGGKKVDDDGTGKNTTGTTGKKIHQSTDKGSSFSCTTAQKGTRNRSQTAKQRKQRSTSTSSPYFKKQPRRRGTRTLSRDMEEEEEDPGNLEQSSKQSSGSDSEYVPEEAKLKKRNLSTAFEWVGDHGDDDNDDFKQPKKKRKRSSSKSVGATPAKKLKQAADRKVKAEVQSKPSKSSSKTSTSRRKSKSTTTSDSMDGGSNQDSGSKHQSMVIALGEDSNWTAASNFDANQSRGSSNSQEGVEILKSEETACWAEVYLTVAGMGGGTSREDGKIKNSKERWTCVHLPSLSVDLPHLCEKHCTIPLHYVIAIENGRFVTLYGTFQYIFIYNTVYSICIKYMYVHMYM